MKDVINNSLSKQLQQIILAVILICILSLSNITLLDTAVAAPQMQPPQEAVQSKEDSANQISARLSNAVRQDLARKVGIPVKKLKITKFSRKTWPDGCLGIPKPDEVCTQVLVEGWHITLSDGHSSWIYRTDNGGRVLRLEKRFDAGLKAAPAIAPYSKRDLRDLRSRFSIRPSSLAAAVKIAVECPFRRSVSIIAEWH